MGIVVMGLGGGYFRLEIRLVLVVPWRHGTRLRVIVVNQGIIPGLVSGLANSTRSEKSELAILGYCLFLHGHIGLLLRLLLLLH